MSVSLAAIAVSKLADGWVLGTSPRMTIVGAALTAADVLHGGVAS